MREVEKHQDKNIRALSDDEIAEILDKAEELAKWAKKVKEYALQKVLRGEKITGFKLVEGRKSRCYSVDDDKIVSVLFSMGYQENTVYKREVRSVADMEKTLGGNVFHEILGEYITTKSGAPILVPVEDKREEWNSPEADFKEVETF